MLRKLLNMLRKRGVGPAARAIYARVQRYLARPSESFHGSQCHFSGKMGIEIGGPSQVFTSRGVFPVYPIVGELDNCNYRHETIWQGRLNSGRSFMFNPRKPLGRQFIAEATSVSEVPSEEYDFVLASHVLEHTANPILALREWMRLLKVWGVMVLLLPDKRRTFDHRRPVTTLAHLIADYRAGTTEDDLTHLPEILALHDLTRDFEAGDAAAFKARSENNQENRCLHHHVFDDAAARELMEHMGLEVLVIESHKHHHILVLARKGQRGETYPP